MEISIVYFRWFLFFFCFLLTLMFLYESWMNLIRGKISCYSLDSLYIRLIKHVSIKWGKKVENDYKKHPGKIKLLGVYSFIGFLTGLYTTIMILNDILFMSAIK